MRTAIIPYIIGAIIGLTASCGSTVPLKKPTMESHTENRGKRFDHYDAISSEIETAKFSQAEILRKYCAKNNINTPEAVIADSLLATARATAQRGEKEAPYWLTRLAICRYQLALAYFEQKVIAEKVKELEKNLSVTKQQLGKYEEVLKELEQMRNQ
jgi:hypothetical protein